MEKLHELLKYLKELGEYNLPEYSDIPNGIKMEDSINYINSVLVNFNNSEGTQVTNYMINNYVKAKIINAPVDKTYSKEEIAYTIFISLLKNSASLRNIASLIAIDKDYTEDKNELYDFCKKLQEETNEIVTLEALENSKKAENMSDEKQILIRFAYTALKLYVKSSTEKLVADSIMNLINGNILPEKALKDDKKEKVLEKKILDKEAKALSKR